MLKANPSPKGNGFAFNLFGENIVINENTAFVIKNRVVFVVIMNNPKSDANRI